MESHLGCRTWYRVHLAFVRATMGGADTEKTCVVHGRSQIDRIHQVLSLSDLIPRNRGRATNACSTASACPIRNPICRVRKSNIDRWNSRRFDPNCFSSAQIKFSCEIDTRIPTGGILRDVNIIPFRRRVFRTVLIKISRRTTRRGSLDIG